MRPGTAKQPSHGLRESLLTILTRNPWVAPAMPQFTDTRGETGRTLNWSGKHTSKEDPLSGVLHKAILALKTLQARGFLLGDKLPSGGFVAPVEVPLLPVPRDQDAIDAMIDKDAQPPPKVAVVLPPTGAKKHAGELPLPATTVSVVLEPVAAHGAEVIISSRRQDDCQKVVDGIRQSGGQASAMACHWSNYSVPPR